MNSNVQAIAQQALQQLNAVKAPEIERRAQEYIANEATPANAELQSNFDATVAELQRQLARTKQDNIDKARLKANCEVNAEYNVAIDTLKSLIITGEGA